jgi:beta-phosphoglucomutase-like phosphatase (HAD superfamily)
MMRALLCELEGVLFDTAALRREAMVRAVASFGCTLPDAWRASASEPPIVPADAPAAAEAAGLDSDSPLNDLLGLAASRFFLEAVSLGGVALTDGAASFVSGAAAQLRLVAVTRARRGEADAILSQSPFADAFSFVVAEEDTLHGKPHPAPYHAALARLRFGPHGPAASLALEHGAIGIASASAAGVMCIAVGSYANKSVEPPVTAMPSLTAVSRQVLARFGELSAPGVVV